MDVFWRLEVPIEKHYSAFIPFLDIYFANVMFPLLLLLLRVNVQ